MIGTMVDHSCICVSMTYSNECRGEQRSVCRGAHWYVMGHIDMSWVCLHLDLGGVVEVHVVRVCREHMWYVVRHIMYVVGVAMSWRTHVSHDIPCMSWTLIVHCMS